MTREEFILGALRALLGHDPDAVGLNPQTGKVEAVVVSLRDVDSILRTVASLMHKDYPPPAAPRTVDPRAN